MRTAPPAGGRRRPVAQPPSGGLGSSAAFACSATAANAGGIADGEVGEHLAVELDPGLAQAGDELVVREPVLPRAALMRMIQSWRNVRFLFLRSR